MRGGKQFLLVVLVFFGVVSLIEAAPQITPERRLRKMSLQIRGILPSLEELAELDKQRRTNPEQLNEYFKSVATSYLESDEFIYKFTDQVKEFLGLNTNIYSHIIRKQKVSEPDHPLQNLKNLLYKYASDFDRAIMTMVRSGSWSDLLLKEQYLTREKLSRVAANEIVEHVLKLNKEAKTQLPLEVLKEKWNQVDFRNPPFRSFPKWSLPFLSLSLNDENEAWTFYEQVNGLFDIPEAWQSLLQHDWANNRPGLLAHGAWRKRYSLTPFSLAASFHRVFLCDEMRPIPLVNPDETKSILARLKGRQRSSESHARTPDLKKLPEEVFSEQHPHGIDLNSDHIPPELNPILLSEPHVQGQCISCHQYLSPARFTLENPEKSLTFYYRGLNNQPQALQAENLVNLVEQLGETDSYLNCQTKRFWEWFIGEDVPLKKSQLAEVRAAFEDRQYNPKKMISYLLQREEYRSPSASSEPLAFDQVAPILNECSSCHNDFHKKPPPAFNRYPIAFHEGSVEAEGKSQEEQHFAWWSKIIRSTNLLGSEKKAQMPPSWWGWELSKTERRNLLRYIAEGVRDKEGRPTLSPDQVSRLLMGLPEERMQGLWSLKPSYRSQWSRYLHGRDFINALSQIFPQGWRACTHEGSQTTEEKVRGYFAYFNEKSLVQRGEFNFVTQQWLAECLPQVIRLELDHFIASDRTKHPWLPLDELASVLRAADSGELMERNWQRLPTAMWRRWRDGIAQRLWGRPLDPLDDPVEMDKGLMDLEEARGKPLNLYEALVWSLYDVVNDPRFFVY